MECENIFCVYQHNDKCILDGPISINLCGHCDECIYITNISKRTLTREKRKVLREWAEDEADWERRMAEQQANLKLDEETLKKLEEIKLYFN